MPDDLYQQYYQDKLWNLLPAIYRTLDTDSFNANGPLREMVNRIGAQAAVVRRSIDRLWEDQSIETCDDWVIAYIGDLLATNLVNSLDARGQRLDVANTIYYRRRKGTLAILEQIAADITGWDARVVEFFRRLGRTRHDFDAPIGTPVEKKLYVTQPVGTGDGATTVFTFALKNIPIERGTVEIVVAGSTAATDNGSGVISGGTVSGTIDYDGGAVSLTFAAAPALGTPIAVIHEYLDFDLTLQVAEGLVGSLTHSQIGGWANLRNSYGASKAQTAFDEFSHCADLRLGVDMVGWHNISHLGVFLWRLYSLALDQTTPVKSLVCPGQFSFDPTGRQVPLFAAQSRGADSYGDNWVSPQEWQLPGEIATPLLQSALTDPADTPLYATVDASGDFSLNSIGVFTNPGTGYVLLDPSHFLDSQQRPTIYPERGCFKIEGVVNGSPFVTYNYGFSSQIGAGPFNRQLPGTAAIPAPPPTATLSAGANIPDPSPTGTIVIGDSLTYGTVSDFTNIDNAMLQAAQSKRPVLRLPASSVWTLTGANNQSELVLDGLLVSGCDIVLAGSFASVTFTCCTLDPGNVGATTVFAQSVDERDLQPCRLWIEASIDDLTLDRCITGAIHTRNGGSVVKLSVNDSIIQGIPTSDLTKPMNAGDIQDPVDLGLALRAPGALAVFLHGKLTPATADALKNWDGTSQPASALEALAADLTNDLNVVIESSFYTPSLFDGITLSPATMQLAATNPTGKELVRLNRMLLAEAYPVAFAQAALALGSGEVDLSRTTVLGRTFVHRIEASECILDDFAVVEDTQHGCVRFSAWSVGSVLPQQYESVLIAAQSSIFTSREFGQPGYGQLLASADAAILPSTDATAGATILQGAQDGSEMGAFAREKNPIKERSILIKYQEYMPLGLAQVLVRVT
ncbi:MAG TPA: hypothetical protein VKF84_18210 [Candidatus Sulfotelmatobacter sp.]|nr:hypothetical protein [Candidatus Sulfotelmatobacter sp.]